MFLIILSILLLLIFVHLYKKQQYWKERNIRSIQSVPIFGNMWHIFRRTKSFVEILQDQYNSYPEERFIGMYLMSQPMLLIKDPDLIKQITVKEFDSFPEHRRLIDENADPLWGKNLFSSREEKWKQLRPTLSPAFTSSKMKQMFLLLKECAEDFVKYYEEKNESIVTVDSKDMFSRYANDVIATAAFGVKCNSLKNPNNEFYLMGKDATNLSGTRILKFMVGPKITKLFNLKIFSKAVRTFFTNLIAETISIRESKGIIRLDMIHLLMQARNGTLTKEEVPSVNTGFATVRESETITSNSEKKKMPITLDDITAQALIFFIAGFDAASTLMSFMAHELAVNPEIQDKLRVEIDEAFDDCNGNITYEKLMGLKYLDMVTSESLRKWPPTPVGDRMCVKPYTILPKNKNETPVLVEKNIMVGFPIFPLHRDPKLFPNPEKFDPERFNDENKHNIHPYAYIPFGMGPRNCIGSRFALMETKLIFFYILKHFEIEVIEKTPIPIKLIKEFNLAPEGGFWVGLKKRAKI